MVICINRVLYLSLSIKTCCAGEFFFPFFFFRSFVCCCLFVFCLLQNLHLPASLEINIIVFFIFNLTVVFKKAFTFTYDMVLHLDTFVDKSFILFG